MINVYAPRDVAAAELLADEEQKRRLRQALQACQRQGFRLFADDV